MKQDLNVSKFLGIHADKSPKAPPFRKTQCEVIAVAPVDPEKDKKASYSLHKEFKEYREVLDRLQENKELSTAGGASCLVRFSGLRGGSHVLVVGTGKDKEGINELGAAERLRRIGASVASKLGAEKIKQATIHLDTFLVGDAGFDIESEDAAYAFAEGLGLSTYRFTKYFSESPSDKKKAKPKNESTLEVQLVSADATRVAAYKRGVDRAEAMLAGAFLARDLSNEPSNYLFPESFAARARSLSTSLGLKFSVLDERQMAKEGMGLLLGVGQGSARPPRLFIMEYNPKGKKAAKTIAFVGKGITFDSGGISIKPSAKMEDMKHDMSGSAAVVGAIVAAAKLKLDTRIIAIVAAAENMPGGKAVCPGNILRARNGKTVEITNTDAEGRLVLADALDYVQDMKPDYVIDLATLTGAVIITLGKTCSGLMGNDASFNALVQSAAKDSGERVWELPLYDEYFDELRSEFADMRNSGDGPSHGTAKGAMFIKQFIRKGVKWVHLDIAAMAYGVPGISYYPKKSGTGWGVRLLVELAKKI